MNTNSNIKAADKVQAAFQIWKKGAIAEKLGMSRNTLKARLKDNSFHDAELDTLKKLGIV